jgi:basic amino acid/polyamine antiporter, APA family
VLGVAVRTDRPLPAAERAASAAERFRVAYRRLLVPLGTGAETAQAMSVACRLAADRHAAVVALTVIEVPPELPLDCHMLEEESEAGQRAVEARAISELYGVRISARTMRARSAGEAIVEEAARAGVDAIVIGAPRKQRTGTRAPIFGRTVDVVLRRAPCRVIIAALPVNPRGHATA